MNEQLVQSLAKLTGLSQEDLTKQLEESPEKLADAISNVKTLQEGQQTFTTEELDTYYSNRLKTFSEDDIKKLPQDAQKKIYDINKGNIMEKFEKDVKREYGIQAEFGKDYTNAVELVGLARKKGGETNTDYKSLYEDLKSESEKKLTEVKEAEEKRLLDYVISGAQNSVKSLIPDADKHEAKLKFATYEFNSKFDVKDIDGTFAAVDKETGKPMVDEKHNILPVDQVYKSIASEIVPLQTTVPNSGRGGEEQPLTPSGDVKYTKFQSLDEFINVGLKEMGVSKDDPRFIEEVEKYEQATAQ